MYIVLAGDHAGFALKEALKRALGDDGHRVVDVGPSSFVPEDDYVEYCARAAEAVAQVPNDRRAILCGGSGQGEAIVANRFRGVRAVVWNGASETARERGLDEIVLSREHNDANVLSVGARFVEEGEAIAAARTWLATPFSYHERHVRRILKLEGLS